MSSVQLSHMAFGTYKSGTFENNPAFNVWPGFGGLCLTHCMKYSEQIKFCTPCCLVSDLVGGIPVSLYTYGCYLHFDRTVMM
jgi:hypothetical protein